MAKQFKKANNKVQRVVKKKTRPSKAAQTKAVVSSKVTLPNGDYVATIGRRKNATARVRLYHQAGDYAVNDKPMTEYFNAVINPEVRFLKPFTITNTSGKYAVSVKVSGSGQSAQLDAAVMGIARALLQIDPDFRKPLRDAGLLTRDPRMKETRKAGHGGSARAKRQSPKR